MKKISLIESETPKETIPFNWKGNCTTFLGFEPCVLVVSCDEIERDELEKFDGEIFETIDDFKKYFKGQYKEVNYIIIPLKDFTKFCNDQAFDAENSWISYVRINQNFSVYL